MENGRSTAQGGREEIRRRVAHLLHEVTGIPIENVREDTSIEDDLRMESVAFVELQVAIESEYGIEVDPIQVVELDRFGDVVDYIASLVDGGA